MGFFDRRFGSRKDIVPEWARFLTLAEYRLFARAVVEDLTGRGLAPEIGDGVVDIQSAGNPEGHALMPDGVQNIPEAVGKSSLGLLNLAQACRTLPQEEWPACVHAHFDSVFSMNRALDQIDTMSLEQIRPLLKVRRMHEEVVRAGGASVIHRPWAGDLVCALALDLPTTVATIDPKAAQRWGLTHEELFCIGEQNVLAEGLFEAQKTNGQGGAEFRFLATESFFVSAHTLFLERYLGAPSVHGAIVAVPTRHIVLFHYIIDASVIPAIQSLITTTLNLHEKGPGSLSFQLYWWTPTSVTCLPVRRERDKINFYPTDEFAQRVLNPLGGRGA